MGINLRTDEELDAVIDRLAQRFGLSRQKAIARVLIEADQQDARAKRMASARARVLGEWSETLDILSKS